MEVRVHRRQSYICYESSETVLADHKGPYEHLRADPSLSNRRTEHLQFAAVLAFLLEDGRVGGNVGHNVFEVAVAT